MNLGFKALLGFSTLLRDGVLFDMSFNLLNLERMETKSQWGLNSWKSKNIRHQPEYEDQEALSKVLEQIETVPKIVDVEDISSLQKELKEVCLGNRMLVHLGDCAETFED